MSPLNFTCVTLQDRLCNSILMQWLGLVIRVQEKRFGEKMWGLFDYKTLTLDQAWMSNTG